MTLTVPSAQCNHCTILSVLCPLIRPLFVNMCPNPAAFSSAYALAAAVFETLRVFVLEIAYSAMAIFIVVCPHIVIIVRLSSLYRIVSSRGQYLNQASSDIPGCHVQLSLPLSVTSNSSEQLVQVANLDRNLLALLV